MLRNCTVCQQMVEAEGHTHVEKPCQVCHVVKPLAAFPIHKSSLDGHKHTCQECYGAQLGQQRTQRAQERAKRIQDRRSRPADNALLRRHQYHWRKVPVLYYDDIYSEGIDEGIREWQLFDPHNQPVDFKVAIAAVRQLEAEQRAAIMQVRATVATQPDVAPMRPRNAASVGSDLARLLAADLEQLLILDTETTGLRDEDEVIEVTLVRAADGQVVFSSLVRPEHLPLPQIITNITGIKTADVERRPHFRGIWPRVAHLLSTHPVAIYNAAFDLRILRANALRHVLPWPSPEHLNTWCVMLAYQAYRMRCEGLSELPAPSKLGDACALEGLEIGRGHRAAGDCQSTRALVLHMRKTLLDVVDMSPLI